MLPDLLRPGGGPLPRRRPSRRPRRTRAALRPRAAPRDAPAPASGPRARVSERHGPALRRTWWRSGRRRTGSLPPASRRTSAPIDLGLGRNGRDARSDPPSQVFDVGTHAQPPPDPDRKHRHERPLVVEVLYELVGGRGQHERVPGCRRRHVQDVAGIHASSSGIGQLWCRHRHCARVHSRARPAPRVVAVDRRKFEVLARVDGVDPIVPPCWTPSSSAPPALIAPAQSLNGSSKYQAFALSTARVAAGQSLRTCISNPWSAPLEEDAGDVARDGRGQEGRERRRESFDRH